MNNMKKDNKSERDLQNAGKELHELDIDEMEKLEKQYLEINKQIESVKKNLARELRKIEKNLKESIAKLQADLKK